MQDQRCVEEEVEPGKSCWETYAIMHVVMKQRFRFALVDCKYEQLWNPSYQRIRQIHPQPLYILLGPEPSTKVHIAPLCLQKTQTSVVSRSPG